MGRPISRSSNDQLSFNENRKPVLDVKSNDLAAVCFLPDHDDSELWFEKIQNRSL